jgi:hypothetical protein
METDANIKNGRLNVNTMLLRQKDYKEKKEEILSNNFYIQAFFIDGIHDCDREKKQRLRRSKGAV